MRTYILNTLLCITIILSIAILFFSKPTTMHNNFNTFYSDYINKYDVDKYVNSKLNGNNFVHNKVMSALINSEQYFSSNNIFLKSKTAINTLFDTTNYSNYLTSLQFQQTCNSIAQKQIVETYESNMKYSGCLDDLTLVSGNMSYYKEKDEYILVVSFVDQNNIFDLNKLKLLANDEISEQITYDIIANMQYDFNTNMTPDVASHYFFNSSVEQVAGSISYHATAALYIFENNLEQPLTLKRLEQVNISTKDYDAFIVNHSY